MQDKKTEKQFYDRMFSQLKGDEDGHCITYGYDEIIKKHLQRLPRGTLLDVGSGSGKNSVRLAKMGFKVVAIELSDAGISAARKHAHKEGQKVLWVQGDVEHMPFKDGAFDISFCGLILHHFPKADMLIEELSRVTQNHLFALEVNALEPQSFIKFNIINALVGHPAMSRNQRAVFPGKTGRRLLQKGFKKVDFEYVDIHSAFADKGIKNFLRRIYSGIVQLLPVRFRNNKFFMVAQR